MKYFYISLAGILVLILISYLVLQPIYLNVQSYDEVKQDEQSVNIDWNISTRTGKRQSSKDSFLDERNVGQPYTIRFFIDTENLIDEALVKLEVRSLGEDKVVLYLKPDFVRYRNCNESVYCYSVNFSNLDLPKSDIALTLTGVEYKEGEQEHFTYKSVFEINITRKIISHTLWLISSV